MNGASVQDHEPCKTSGLFGTDRPESDWLGSNFVNGAYRALCDLGSTHVGPPMG